MSSSRQGFVVMPGWWRWQTGLQWRVNDFG